MLDKQVRKYLSEDTQILNENGIELKLKAENPRNLTTKYFPILKMKKFNIEMGEDDETALIKVSTINDLINIMKALDKDIKFEKNGDVIKIA